MFFSILEVLFKDNFGCMGFLALSLRIRRANRPVFSRVFIFATSDLCTHIRIIFFPYFPHVSQYEGRCANFVLIIPNSPKHASKSLVGTHGLYACP